MAPVISVHEYVLKAGVDGAALERAFHDAAARGLFRLPGLVGYRLVRGVKGTRRGAYAAFWEYESRAVWERIWGEPDRPISPDQYPQTWQIWEREILAPLLTDDPDLISYTSYEVLGAGF